MLRPDQSIEGYICQSLKDRDPSLSAYLEHYALDQRRAGWKYLANLGTESRVLDFGCGWGALALSLAPHCRQVWAVDAVPERVAVVLKRAAEAGRDNVHGCVSTGWPKLPFRDHSFDIVVLNGVLEWVPTSISGAPRQIQSLFLREVARVLRSGGQLILGIENRLGLAYFFGRREEHTKLKFISLLPRPVGRLYHRLLRKSPYRCYTYGRRGLKGLLKSAGFQENHFFCPYPDYRDFDQVFDTSSASQLKAAFPAPVSLSGKLKKYVVEHVGGMKWLANSFLVFATPDPNPLHHGYMRRLLDASGLSDGAGAEFSMIRYSLSPAANVHVRFRLAEEWLLTLPLDPNAALRLQRALDNRLALQQVLPKSILAPVMGGVFEKIPYALEPFFEGLRATGLDLSSGMTEAYRVLAAFQSAVHCRTLPIQNAMVLDARTLDAFMDECFDQTGHDREPMARLLGADPAVAIGPIHGDFHLGNLLVKPDTGEIRMIDWDCSTQTGMPVWDALNVMVHAHFERHGCWADAFGEASRMVLDPSSDGPLSRHVRDRGYPRTDCIVGCLTYPTWQWHIKMMFGDRRGSLITERLAPVLLAIVSQYAGRM